MRCTPGSLATLFSLVLAAGAAIGQPGSAPAEPDVPPDVEAVFGEAVRVRVVNVEVHVADRKGRPVDDLTAADFEILEDGRPIEVSHFARIAGTRASEAAGAPAGRIHDAPDPADASPAPSAAAPFVASPPSAEPLWLVVYVDNLSLRQGERRRLLGQLREFVGDGFDANTRVMIASFNRSLEILQGFTADTEPLLAALERVSHMPCVGARLDTEWMALVKRIDLEDNAIDAVEAIRPIAEEIRHDLRLTLDTLEGISGRLAGLPGRKAVLYVGGGLPKIAGGALFWAIEHKWANGYALYHMWNYDSSVRFEQLAKAVNGDRVTLHMLDGGGLRPNPSVNVEMDMINTPTIPAMLAPDIRTNLQEPLQQLADRTGGSAILNTNNTLPALRRLADDFGAYYSLGYTPDHETDGAYHRIEVRVARDRARVRHREGYVDKSEEDRVADRLRAGLLQPLDDNPLGVDWQVGAAEASGDDRWLVPLELRVPLDGLTLIGDHGAARGRLRFYIVAMDDEGRVSDVVESPVRVSVPEARAGRPLLYRHSLILRGGHHRLAVGVRDEVSGVTAYLTATADAS